MRKRNTHKKSPDKSIIFCCSQFRSKKETVSGPFNLDDDADPYSDLLLYTFFSVSAS